MKPGKHTSLLNHLLAAAALVLTLGFAEAAHASVTIKLATIAPEGSTWHKALTDLAAKWKEASGGQVTLKIYPGGTQGDEGDMVRKMRVGQLSAAAISAVGLHDITPEPQALATPLLIRSYDELDYVLSKMGGDLEKALADKGFVVLTWSDAGFVYFFSKKPAATPAEMAQQPLFAWAGDPKAVEAWKAAGFKPVVISSTDMVPSLQTGMIQSFTTSALLAVSIGWYNYAPNMTNVTWGILPGAVVVTKEQWEKIPADLRPKLLDAARGVGSGLNTTLRQQSTEAIDTMKKHGLNVVEVTPEQKQLWIKSAESSYPVIRGGTVPAETFDAVKKYVDEYRAQHK
jgi:TRAP-type C4-dicarboxylate transport system substrate-binding protein